MSGDRTVINVHPVYLMLDVSESMQRPLPSGRTSMETFVPLLDMLLFELSGLARINSTVWVGILAFSDDVQVLRPISPLNPYRTPDRPREGRETNYAAALRFLTEAHPIDQEAIERYEYRRGRQARVSRPLVFVVTDGAPFANRRDQPDAEWLDARDSLVKLPIGARIAAVSHLEQYETTLWQLATGRRNGDRNAFLASADAAPDELAASIKQCIVNSITNSIRAGELVMHKPDGMRRARQHVQP